MTLQGHCNIKYIPIFNNFAEECKNIDYFTEVSAAMIFSPTSALSCFICVGWTLPQKPMYLTDRVLLWVQNNQINELLKCVVCAFMFWFQGKLFKLYS